MALELAGLSVVIAGNRPISGLELALADGAALAIVGRANSGKTLLAQAIAGLLPAEASVEGAGLPTERPGLIGPDTDLAELARCLDRAPACLSATSRAGRSAPLRNANC